MSFVFSFAQLICWVMVGYNIALHNNWAAFGLSMLSLSLGLMSAMNDVGKAVKERGITN
jgi:hypothetical protein